MGPLISGKSRLVKYYEPFGQLEFCRSHHGHWALHFDKSRLCFLHGWCSLGHWLGHGGPSWVCVPWDYRTVGVTNGNLRGFPQCHIKPTKNGRGPLLRGYEAHHHPLIRPAIKALFPRGETWHWGGRDPSHELYRGGQGEAIFVNKGQAGHGQGLRCSERCIKIQNFRRLLPFLIADLFFLARGVLYCKKDGSNETVRGKMQSFLWVIFCS